MSDTSNDADVAFVAAMARLLRESDLSELRVKRDRGEEDCLDIRISRYPAAPPPPPQAAAPPRAVPMPSDPAPAPASSPEPEDPASHPGAVTSPMVGTAFLAPEPGAPPFVRTGDEVKEGQSLMIVEAMKTMNHIPAPRDGIIRRVLVEDGAPVEFGAPLMIIE